MTMEEELSRLVDEDVRVHKDFVEHVRNNPTHTVTNGKTTVMAGIPRDKDVAPHHITPECYTLGDILVGTRQLPKEPIQRLLDRADASLVSTDSGSYLRDVGVSTADLVNRLRHRATLMRQRADEFDTMADLHEGASFQSVRTAIERHDELSQEIEALLKRHAHVNPTAVHT